MKRSESDRFIAGSSSHEQEVSAEVYLIVTEGDRCRAVLVSWRYLALAIAIFAAAAAIVASREFGRPRGRSSSASVTSARPSARSIQVPPAALTPAASCVDVGGYGGLGARVSAFDANNNESTGPGGPSPGNAFYVVTATAKGCVTAFAVQDSSTPPLTARGLLVLVSHPLLPSDTKQVADTDRCVVWKSRALMRATGRAYARATAIVQAGSVPGTAQIAATSDSSC
jgi:hypothetical protein